MVYPLLVVAALAALSHSKQVARTMQVPETRQEVPPNFALVGTAPPDITLHLRVALAQSDIAGLEKAFYDVSTPCNELYGRHLSKEEVESYVTPKPETVSAVTAWLKENHIEATTASPAGDWLSFLIPVSKANTLLDANFSEFIHIESGTTFIRTLAYSIPTDLQGHLEFVHPTTVFAEPFHGPQFVAPPKIKNTSPSTDAIPAECSSAITPLCLQLLYGIPTTPATVQANVIGVSGFSDQYAEDTDLQTFLGRLRPDMPSTTTFSLQSVDGGVNPQPGPPGVEASLDIQYTLGVATEVPIVFISVGNNTQDGVSGFLDIINALLNETNPPNVLTTSYGFDEPGFPVNLASSICNAYMQLGARGTSILFASGDGGVAGSRSQTCTTFVPTFPSGCPYVTIVGATSGTVETAASFSSGGFSNIFPRPSYQDDAVSPYLTALGSANEGLYNATGRAYPDVSAQGEDVEIALGGQFGVVGGTSCSSPIFASVVGLLNDELIAAGKSPLGFLNPWLYLTGASALNDITTGSNPGCNTTGFPASTGWDPVTGLGTPNYAKLKAAVGL